MLYFVCPFVFQLELTPKEQDQKRKLIEAAFGNWSRKDLRAFVAATERHGRDDTEAVLRDVCLETAKPEEKVSIGSVWDILCCGNLDWNGLRCALVKCVALCQSGLWLDMDELRSN